MYFSLLPLLSSLVLALNLQQIVSKPITHHESIIRIPSRQESAVLARRILRLTPIATFSTVFPSDNLGSNSNSSWGQRSQEALRTEQRPLGLGNTPIGLMDYVADCETNGNPTILAISIATAFKNVAAGSNISLSFTWTPPSSSFSSLPFPFKRVDYSAASLPRFALFGHLQSIDAADVEDLSIKECFVKTHSDAKNWLPGNKIHTSIWVRFVVQQIYWIGGFGDRAYIGWIPVKFWQGAREEEIEQVRLPGEKRGFKELLNDLIGG